MPARSRWAGVAWVRSRPFSVTRPATVGRSPISASHSSVCPLPCTPATPRISPARTSKDIPFTQTRPVSSATVRSDTSSTTSPGLAASLLTRSCTFRPTISAASSSSVADGGRLADHRAAAQHGDRVRDGLDFLELVRDEDDRRAAVLELPDDPEQVLGLGRGQHRGRLVEDQHGRLPDQCLDDLDPLLDADRQVLHQGVRVDLQAVAVGELAHVLARLAPVEQAGGAGLLDAEGHVLRDGEHGHEHEVLVHHADAGRDGVLGRVELDRLRRRARSRPRRAAAARTGRSSGSSCRRRSRRAGRAPDPGPPTDRSGRWPPANRTAW